MDTGRKQTLSIVLRKSCPCLGLVDGVAVGLVGSVQQVKFFEKMFEEIQITEVLQEVKLLYNCILIFGGLVRMNFEPVH